MMQEIGVYQIAKTLTPLIDQILMRKNYNWSYLSKCLFRIGLQFRRLFPRKRCKTFAAQNENLKFVINHIYVINLKRKPSRWKDINLELQQIEDISGAKLNKLAERYNAVDAKDFLNNPIKNDDLDPEYTLEDQLFVEPQRLAMPTQLDLQSKIQMSRPEVGIAYSHIELWKKIAIGNNEFTLILEDDVWFKPGFSRELDKAWREIKENGQNKFDILYLSYEEVKNGAPKTFISNNLFRPVRGLWNLSGYVISRQGAKRLLKLLPCKGPIDLWINHKFKFLNVLATRNSIINQRPDLVSTNSYSILPTLTKIGAITSEGAALFHNEPVEVPVFAFGSKESGLTSLAMALSMLGYKCCSDLETLPDIELENLLKVKRTQLFNAYVNINIIQKYINDLTILYPNAKFIFTINNTEHLDERYSELIKNLHKSNFVILNSIEVHKWQIICQLLRVAPPDCSFPELIDRGYRRLDTVFKKNNKITELGNLKWDYSPWVIEIDRQWNGIDIICDNRRIIRNSIKEESFKFLNDKFWISRDDTFTDNLALFRKENVKFDLQQGLQLIVKRNNLGVRNYSAGAITSNDQYLYGRFEVILRASNVPGVITGFFLHRNSPRQEIDIEIAGKAPDRLLVNVFYNPGEEGAKFDYGYRGTPTSISLGFDASLSFHKYIIEWDEFEIRWFVDDILVHRRIEWNPTPIPCLPMSLHLNIWPCRSKDFAGVLTNKLLPATTVFKKVLINAQKI